MLPSEVAVNPAPAVSWLPDWLYPLPVLTLRQTNAEGVVPQEGTEFTAQAYHEVVFGGDTVVG